MSFQGHAVFQNLQFLTKEFSFQNYLREQRILTRERNKECLRENKIISNKIQFLTLQMRDSSLDNLELEGVGLEGAWLKRN